MRVDRIDLDAIAPLIRLDRSLSTSLQTQIRTRIVDAIHQGILPPGVKLPSARKLSRKLSISRNTAALAYQDLVASGHLQSRERSGFFVAVHNAANPQPAANRLADANLAGARLRTEQSAIMRLSPVQNLGHSGFRFPPDWRQYEFPFLEGLYDRTLFPTVEWREASRMALSVNEVASWSTDTGEADDELMIEELRRKILPRRGIAASPDEILVTTGEQQALHLAVELLCKPDTKVLVEDPGPADLRSLLVLKQAAITHQPVDNKGIIIDESLADCEIVYTSPSRQRPTGVTLIPERRAALMEMARAHDLLIIEDDFESEMGLLSSEPPALKSDDPEGRVAYIGSLSKVLAPGLRLGFLIGPPDFIRAARRLRNLTTRRPSPVNQRTAGIFLSLGHYDTMLRRLSHVYERRLISLRDALNHYCPLSIAIPPVTGGTAYWVRGPEGLDAELLLVEAQTRGVLIEPAHWHFADPAGRSNMFRLGVTSLPEEKIRPGIKALTQVLLTLDPARSSAPAKTNRSASRMITAAEMHDTLDDAQLNYRTVYGDPCSLVLHADGRLTGRAGYAQEDCDEGRWWTEGDFWCRQWDRWAYCEVSRFRIEIDGNQLYWINPKGKRVDRATFAQVEQS